MARTVLVQSVKPYLTAVGTDIAVNTFHYQWTGSGDPANSDLDNAHDAIVAFFNDTPFEGAAAICARLSNVHDRSANACVNRFYFLPATPGVLGSPVYTKSWTLGAYGGGANLPSEVAFAITERAILTDVPETAPNPEDPTKIIRPASRRRGRIFLGPLGEGTLASTTTSTDVQRPNTTFMDDARNSAAQRLAAGLGTDMFYAVFSETDWVARGVVDFQTDNAFDTIRSRGEASTARVTTGI